MSSQSLTQPATDAPLTLTLHRSIAGIAAADWNRCAGADNPFVSHAFLGALEASGSVCAETGWLPQHAVLRDAAGALAGIIPLYAKSHSWGEYVFDEGWAQAFERAGGRYYPKLQAAVPFSPVPGPRLLTPPGGALGPAELGAALAQLCDRMRLSSAHVTFCTEAECQALGEAGWLRRLGTQFHWQNNGYRGFDDFLAALSSRHRKNIRRERRDAQGYGLTFKTLRGDEIKPAHWDAFYRFYQATVDRKWGMAYLTRDFFPLLSARLGAAVVLMLAEQDGRPVAGALNLVGATALYGRNWGSTGDWPFLHFELCYYRAIDFAIAHGLQRVEAGAQGQHKIQRGYLPRPTYSAHWLADPGLRDAVGHFLTGERRAVLDGMEALAALSPFRQGDAD